ncbi:hypothetical protein EYF80_045597 [Liparis tanakae]|uniref:Uncharacterized protein n=1 Tax=Liparis tanakae TaxID=230148 RepID=A0A4Z2FV68_9TELE|nr:hypothetical protein EYF80_045597 [Liparis tanakae]
MALHRCGSGQVPRSKQYKDSSEHPTEQHSGRMRESPGGAAHRSHDAATPFLKKGREADQRKDGGAYGDLDFVRVELRLDGGESSQLSKLDRKKFKKERRRGGGKEEERRHALLGDTANMLASSPKTSAQFL